MLWNLLICLFACRSVATFSPDAPLPSTTRFFADYITHLPYFEPGHWLGAFRGEAMVGGIAVYRRVMRVGAARVPTTCIASLNVLPSNRRQGIARRLLDAAEALARARGDALILLHGIDAFYRHLGYDDVFDVPFLCIPDREIERLPTAELTVRPVWPDDVRAMIGLFERHFGSRPAVFERDEQIQRYFLEWRSRDDPPLVVLDRAGAIVGYVVFDWTRKHWKVVEAVAEDWPSALALLRATRARQLERTDAAHTGEMQLPCPADSTLAHAVADHVGCTHATVHDPDAGWMAKPTTAGQLLSALAPELARRWRWAGGDSNPLPTLAVDNTGVDLAGAVGLTVDAARPSDNRRASARLDGGALAQLVFGYRSAERVARRPGCAVDPAAIPALAALFPDQSAWIAGTDWF